MPLSLHGTDPRCTVPQGRTEVSAPGGTVDYNLRDSVQNGLDDNQDRIPLAGRTAQDCGPCRAFHVIDTRAWRICTRRRERRLLYEHAAPRNGLSWYSQEDPPHGRCGRARQLACRRMGTSGTIKEDAPGSLAMSTSSAEYHRV